MSRDHAKLLWQRLPVETKQVYIVDRCTDILTAYVTTQNNSELSNLWEIGKKLWKHEFSEIYELSKNSQWPEYLLPLVSALVGKLV